MRSNLHSRSVLIAPLMLVGVIAASEAEERTGVVFATSSPPGAYVYLDGELIGRTPVAPLSIEAGSHRLWFRSRPPGDFEPLPLPEHAFSISPGETIAVAERIGRLVRIESEPGDARVMRGAVCLGTTPALLRWHADAPGMVRVVHDGYFSAELRPERLAEGGVIRIRLEPIGPLPRTTPLVGDSDGRGERWPAWGAVALGAGCTALALHLKAEADDAYDRYAGTALPAEMDRQLRRADRLDRYAVVTWVVAEASFLAAILLFTDGALLKESGVRPAGSFSRDGGRLGAQWRF
jgi:hypothetical protein